MGELKGWRRVAFVLLSVVLVVPFVVIGYLGNLMWIGLYCGASFAEDHACSLKPLSKPDDGAKT